jgi:hypothetical protein
MRPRGIFFAIAICLIIIIFSISLFWQSILWSFIIIVALIFLGVMDVFNKKSDLKNNFPVIDHLRYLLEFNNS